MPEWVTAAAVIAMLIAVGTALFRGGHWIGKVDSQLSSISTAIEEIRSDIKNIFRRIQPVVQGESPLVLTDYGKDLADKLDSKELAEGLAPLLVGPTQGMEEFEVYDYCVSYLEKSLTEEWSREVSRRAYDIGINAGVAKEVLAIVLRDELLERLGREPGDS